jgi:hypothetical protein
LRETLLGRDLAQGPLARDPAWTKRFIGLWFWRRVLLRETLFEHNLAQGPLARDPAWTKRFIGLWF